MVDIHCHIVPEVDDGAWDLDAAMEMARLAVKSGVRRIIATPHFQGKPEHLESVSYIVHQFKRLESSIKRERLELELLPGMEVLCVPETMELARMGQQYQKQLSNEVVRLVLMLGLKLEEPVLRSAAEKLGGAELVELRDALRERAAEKYPIQLQLGTVRGEEALESGYLI